MDFEHVQAALVGEQGQPVAGCAAQNRLDGVALAQPGSGRVLEFAHALDPAIAAEDDRGFFVDDIRCGVVAEFFAGPRAPCIAVALAQLAQLVTNHGPASGLVGQQSAQLLGPFLLIGLLGTDLVDFQPRQLIQTDVEDGLGLRLVEPKTGHELVAGVLARLCGADGLNHRIKA